MAGEALQCSYVVLSVGRYLNPALAVRNLNPGISPSPLKSGAFFAQKSAVVLRKTPQPIFKSFYSDAVSAPLSANSIQSANTV